MKSTSPINKNVRIQKLKKINWKSEDEIKKGNCKVDYELKSIKDKIKNEPLYE